MGGGPAVKRFSFLIAAALVLSFLAGCSGASGRGASMTRELFAMDTYMTMTCRGENAEQALDAAEAEILRLDALLSTGSTDSEISRLNAEGGGACSEDTAALLRAALDAYRETDGAFDCTILPLMELWGFPSGTLHVPTEAELEHALTVTGSRHVSLSGSAVSMDPGTKIDLGGIAKGFTSGRLMEIFRSFGVESAIVSLGGNVQCLGSRSDGAGWRCGIRAPGDGASSDYIAGVVTVRDKAVITSGSYERRLTDEVTGRIYHHILDPSTGRPADTGLASVTIVSSDGTLADALSTACFVMGEEKAEAFWRERFDEFDMILIRTDGSIRVTEGVADAFVTSRPCAVIPK